MKTKTLHTAWNRIMMAVAFAEADDEQSAREIMEAKLNETEADDCRLPHACPEIG